VSSAIHVLTTSVASPSRRPIPDVLPNDSPADWRKIGAVSYRKTPNSLCAAVAREILKVRGIGAIKKAER
jgi:hypothetical protein